MTICEQAERPFHLQAAFAAVLAGTRHLSMVVRCMFTGSCSRAPGEQCGRAPLFGLIPRPAPYPVPIVDGATCTENARPLRSQLASEATSFRSPAPCCASTALCSCLALRETLLLQQPRPLPCVFRVLRFVCYCIPCEVPCFSSTVLFGCQALTAPCCCSAAV